MADPSRTTTNGLTRPKPGPREINELRQLILNDTTFRRDFLRSLSDPRRSINDECGYPDHLPEAHELQEFYEVEAVAARVVECLPKESFQVHPSVFETENNEEETEFEAAWKDFLQGVSGPADPEGDKDEQNFYQDEEGSLLWEILLRADILSGIGRYGVLLLGLGDSDDLSTPARVKDGQKVLYMLPFPEAMSPVNKREDNRKSPRFGLPTEYGLTFDDPRTLPNIAQTVSTSLQEVKVHWTRVIHLADNLGSSRVYGVPRMRPVYRRLKDLEKIYGADGEAYWKNCLTRLLFESDSSLGGDPDVDFESLKDGMENFGNGLQPWMALLGFKGKTIAPMVVDPTPHVNAQIQAICIKLGIPLRIFMGSERGELASTQDASAWNERVKSRQLNYVTPKLIVPLVNRLIHLGVLPKPKAAGQKPGIEERTKKTKRVVRNAVTGEPEITEVEEKETVVKTRAGFSVSWPDMTSSSAPEKANVALSRARAMKEYVMGGVEALMTPLDFLIREMSYSETEAEIILKNAESAMELKAEEDAKLAEEHGMVPVPPNGFQPPVPNDPPVKVKEGERLVGSDGRTLPQSAKDKS